MYMSQLVSNKLRGQQDQAPATLAGCHSATSAKYTQPQSKCEWVTWVSSHMGTRFSFRGRNSCPSHLLCQGGRWSTAHPQGQRHFCSWGDGGRWHQNRRVIHTSLKALSQQWAWPKPCVSTAQQKYSWALTSILWFTWSVNGVERILWLKALWWRTVLATLCKNKGILNWHVLEQPCSAGCLLGEEKSLSTERASLRLRIGCKSQCRAEASCRGQGSASSWSKVKMLTFWFIGILLSWISLAEVRSDFIGI